MKTNAKIIQNKIIIRFLKEFANVTLDWGSMDFDFSEFTKDKSIIKEISKKQIELQMIDDIALQIAKNLKKENIELRKNNS